MGILRVFAVVVIALGFLAHERVHCYEAGFDYVDALEKGILFFEAQRSGKLPPTQRVLWRGDSALSDGKAEGVDLVGGYYDAGDNVKFGLPMAFTVTMLSWSVIEYGSRMGDQLHYALEAIKWGTDYFIKAHPEPYVLWGEVGDGASDHYCWQRSEDMTTSRKAYKIDATHPGSELAAETAAAMAAASIVFRNSDPVYADTLLVHAKQLFEFADKYRGQYDNSITIAKTFYTSHSGFNDELLWAALWMFEASKDMIYLKYASDNAAAFGGSSFPCEEFSWDTKYVGVRILATKILLEGRAGQYVSGLQSYQTMAKSFACSVLQKNPPRNVQRTPGGLLFVRQWNNMQYVTTSSFILAVYADYLSKAPDHQTQLSCPGGIVTPPNMIAFVKSQGDYILGNNPKKMSYMVGYGNNFPQRVHHRSASVISIKKNPQFVSCLGGYTAWFNKNMPNSNVIVGALVGGPDQGDRYLDARVNYAQNEPTLYTNAALVGLLSRLIPEPASTPTYIPKPPSVYRPSTSHRRLPTPVKNETTSYPVLITQSTGHRHPKGPGPRRFNKQKAPTFVSIKQEVTVSWYEKGQKLNRYKVTVCNVSSKRLSGVKLTIKGLRGPIWGVIKAADKANNVYTFPQWLDLLHPSKSLEFIYVQGGPPAYVYLHSFAMSAM